MIMYDGLVNEVKEYGWLNSMQSMKYSEGSSEIHQNPVMIADNMVKILLEYEIPLCCDIQLN